MSNTVNPSCVLQRGDLIKQFRNPDDPQSIRGRWFTWNPTNAARLGIPSTQTHERYFRVIEPFTCLESTASDAFTGWAEESPAPFSDYRRGGGRQLFVYSEVHRFRHLEVVSDSQDSDAASHFAGGTHAARR